MANSNTRTQLRMARQAKRKSLLTPDEAKQLGDTKSAAYNYVKYGRKVETAMKDKQ